MTTAQAQLGVMAKDDTMDMALSPFQPIDDLDIDFDHMEEPQLMLDDDAMEDYQQVEEAGDDLMNEQELEVIDDDILDDVHEEHQENDDLDVGVSAAVDGEAIQQVFDDDDILYDDDHEEQPLNEQAQETIPSEIGNTDQDQSYPENHTATTNEQQNSEATNTIDTLEAEHGSFADAPLDQPEDATAQPENGQKRPDEDTANLLEILENQVNEDQAKNGTAEVSETRKTDNEPQLLDLAAIEDSAVESALQSIRVFWDNAEWRLFCSQPDAFDCFFRDTNSAYEPMDKFLEACRNVIPADELADHDELTFVIEELGLSICEDSKYAPTLTLARIVELYLTFHRNGSQDPVSIIPCSLQSRTCLQTTYGHLLQDALAGRELKEVVADSIDSAEGTTENNEELDNGAHQDEIFDQANGTHDQEDEQKDKSHDAQQESNIGEKAPAAPAEENSTLTSDQSARALEVAASELSHEVDDDLFDVLDDEEGQELDGPQDAGQAEGGDFLDDLTLDTDIVNEPEQQDQPTATQDTVDQSSVAGATPRFPATPGFGATPRGWDDGPGYHDPGAPAPLDDDLYAEDVELLRQREEEFTAGQPILEPQISFDVTNGAHNVVDFANETHNVEDFAEETHFDDAEDELDLSSLPPDTPQKGANKRKAVEEDDEFDLSAFDTPEPKRPRSS